jgi:hypothetical protein
MLNLYSPRKTSSMDERFHVSKEDGRCENVIFEDYAYS